MDKGHLHFLLCPHICLVRLEYMICFLEVDYENRIGRR